MTKLPFLGYVAYEGPSMLTGELIVMIVNKIDSASANEKTGVMVQTWILRSEDVKPQDVVKAKVACPASAEAGRKSTCEKCGLCNGATSETDRRASIVILPHGAKAKRTTYA